MPWHRTFSDKLSVPCEAEGALRLRASPGWGIHPPRSYFRFDEEAIQSEMAQAEAYAANRTAVPIA